MPARCTRSIAAGTCGRGGSSMATSPARHRSRSASSRRAGTAAPAGSAAAGDRQHAQAAPRVVGHDPGDLVAVRGGDRPFAAVAADPGAAGPAPLPGAPLVFTTRPPSCSSTVVMSLSRGSKRNSWRRRACRRGQGDVHAAAGRQLEQRELGRVTGRLAAGPAAGPRCCTRPRSASEPRPEPPARDRDGRRARRSGWRRARRPGTLTSPSGVQTVVTRIRFSVRVPVLSVQITEVDPRVSTALTAA